MDKKAQAFKLIIRSNLLLPELGSHKLGRILDPTNDFLPGATNHTFHSKKLNFCHPIFLLPNHSHIFSPCGNKSCDNNRFLHLAG